eukprot:4123415-Lingulodinium_polyedra.AAC.1
MLAGVSETNETGDSGRNWSARQVDEVPDGKSEQGLARPAKPVSESLEILAGTSEINETGKSG